MPRFAPSGLLGQDPGTARGFLAQAAKAGIDHVCCGDHVSFAGLGFDGLVQATALATLRPTPPVYCGVYLLPLRHPVLMARQLADIARLARGRLIFGAGTGGEDRHEVAICGVDPATRGPRMDECLTIVRQLLTGKAVNFHGTFFDLDEAVIAPAPAEAVPIIIGGRSAAAIRRAGRLGDGWLGIWNSPRRFAAAVEMAAEEAYSKTKTGLSPAISKTRRTWCCGERRMMGQRSESSLRTRTNACSPEESRKATPARLITSRCGFCRATSPRNSEKAPTLLRSISPWTVTVATPSSHRSRTVRAGAWSQATVPLPSPGASACGPPRRTDVITVGSRYAECRECTERIPDPAHR